jgi:hypothetical protein
MRRLGVGLVAVGLALLVLAPLLGRGFVLVYDMVFTPRQWLLPESVGLSSALPRSVPADAVVALVTSVVPGDLVQQVFLLGALAAGPLGAGLLVPTGSVGVRVVAAVAYGWSGYVAERLFIGHWPYLLAYACLPWVARAALGLRGVGLRPPVSSLPAGTDSSGTRETGLSERRTDHLGNPDQPAATTSWWRAALALRGAGLRPPVTSLPGSTDSSGEREAGASEQRPHSTEPDRRRDHLAKANQPAGPATTINWKRAAGALIVASVPAVLTPSGGLLAAMVGIVCGGRRWLRLTVPVAVVLNAPWWVPALLHPAGGLSSPDGSAAFGARGENWGGVVVSLLGLGGIWNSEVTPASRANPLVPVLVLAVAAVAVLGWRTWRRHWGSAVTGLIVLGAAGILLGALGGTALVGWLAANVPGGGLLRDSQKWVAWWALPLAIGFALGAEAAARTLARTGRLLLVGAAVLPLAMMPDLAWGGWGRLEPVTYPHDWQAVANLLRDDPRTGDVVALPLSTFRQFGWNGDRTQLDPAPRVLPRPTVIDDTLYVSGKAVAGEDRRAADVRAAVAERGDLGSLGIGWVLVEHGTPGEPTGPVTAGMERVYQGEWLDLYRVPEPVTPRTYPTPPAGVVVTADVIALATVTLGLLWLVLPAGRLTPSRPRSRE